VSPSQKILSVPSADSPSELVRLIRAVQNAWRHHSRHEAEKLATEIRYRFHIEVIVAEV
jgi:hypothetical protein